MSILQMMLFASEGPISPAEIVNQLFPNLWMFIAHVLATILLLVLLTKWLYNPFRKAMRARRKFIQDTLDDAVLKQTKATKDQREANRMLTDAKTEAVTIISSARQEAEDKKMKIIEKAQKEASNLSQQAKLAIVKEKEQSKEDIRKSIIEVALDAAGKLLEKDMSNAKNKALVDEFIKDLD